MSIPTWLTMPNGAVMLNDCRRYVKAAFVTPANAQVPVVIAASPGAGIPGRVAPIILEGGEDGLTESYSMIGFHNAGAHADAVARMSCEILDTSYRRKLMNRDVLVDHVFGNRLQPYFLNESIMLTQQQTMAIQFFNNSLLGQTSFDFMMESGKYQASVLNNPMVTEEIGDLRVRKAFLAPFWLTSDAAINLPIGATRTAFFSATRDIFFFAMQIMSRVLCPLGAVVQDNYQFRLFDALTDRPLIDDGQWILESCGTGTSAFPFVLPTALVVEPRTAIRAEFRNLNAAAIEIFFTFGGVSNYVSIENLYQDRDIQPAVATPWSVGVR